MPSCDLLTKPRTWSMAIAMGLALPLVVCAQPANSLPDQYGDRQAGQWGDPSLGYFGNPAKGYFDKSDIRPPPPGVKPLGKIYDGKAPQGSVYVTLPKPVDAAPVAAAEEEKTGKKKRSSKAKKRSEG